MEKKCNSTGFRWQIYEGSREEFDGFGAQIPKQSIEMWEEGDDKKERENKHVVVQDIPLVKEKNPVALPLLSSLFSFSSF